MGIKTNDVQGQVEQYGPISLGTDMDAYFDAPGGEWPGYLRQYGAYYFAGDVTVSRDS